MCNSNGNKRYGRMIRMYKDGYLSVCVYLNVRSDGTKFYDTVIYRKIKGNNGKPEYKRGANLKPTDLPVLSRLIQEADTFLKIELGSERCKDGEGLST